MRQRPAARPPYDVAETARRMQDGSGPLWDLTQTVAKAIHETAHPGKSWENDRVEDGWLAVGTYRQAEAVVAVLPLVVKP